MDEWSALESRLTIAEVDDLLDTAADRLVSLAAGTVLPRSVVASILEALRDVEAAHGSVRDAERRIGTP